MRGALVLFCFLFPFSIFADEVCQYKGNADYSGKMWAQTHVTTVGPKTVVQVLFKIHATALLFIGVDYWMEELTSWENGELQSAATNTRYLVNDEIRRQSWKVLPRNGNNFEGYKLESKHESKFKERYPIFAPIWDLQAFGKDWLGQFQQSSPDRRADYDVAFEPGLTTPLAFAFYGIRFLKQASRIPVFVAGEERQKRVDLQIASAQITSDGSKVWRVPFHAGPLNTAENSPATAEVARDGSLRKMDLSIVHSLGSASGTFISQGCD